MSYEMMDEYHFQDKKILHRIQEDTRKIKTVRYLRDFAATFHHHDAGVLLIKALDYFAESKMTADGRRNGKKIHEHVSNGYGPQLKDTDPITPKLLLALLRYVQRDSPVPLRRGRNAIRNPKFGHGYAIDVINIMINHNNICSVSYF